MNNLKVEGKVADFCPKCKNCKSVTREYDGNEVIRVTEVECEDSYDGMIKTLAADSDICCSMFEPKPDRACKNCERFDGTYCHGPNGTITISYKALFGEPVNCPSYEEKKEKEPQQCGCENIQFMASQVNAMIDDVKRQKDIERNAAVNGLKTQIKQLELGYEALKEENQRLQWRNDNQYKMIQDLEKERDELTERLKNTDISKVANLEAQIKNLQYLNEEGYKREDKLEKDNHLLESKLDKLGEYYRADEKLIDNIQKVIFPQEEGSDYTYSYDEILNKVKELKVQSDKDKTMDKVIYEDLEYWKERCHKAESDVTTLNSKVDVLDKRNTNQFVMIGEKDKEIENLKKMVERRDRWVKELQSDVYTLQNEILTIRDIAQKAYDDTNRD